MYEAKSSYIRLESKAGILNGIMPFLTKQCGDVPGDAISAHKHPSQICFVHFPFLSQPHFYHSALVTLSCTTHLFPPKAATLGQPRLTTRGLAKHLRASCAHDDCLSVAENGGYCETAGAFDVHEEGSRAWNKSLELVFAGFGLRRGVEEVNG